MRNFLDVGNWNALCDSCGRKFKASQLRRRWDGLMVCEEDYELRHPQDFLRVQKEQISVPWARPDPEDTFIPVTYICTPEGTSSIVGLAVAGCCLVGSQNNGEWWLNRTAIVGEAIAGEAVVGYS